MLIQVSKFKTSLLFVLLAFGAVGGVLAQAGDARPNVPTTRLAPNKSGIEIDFLANYYEQDGDRGAVQGGRGTEQLTNKAAQIVVMVPVDSNSALTASFGADYYSSASTDRIDYQLSTASSDDRRLYGSLGWTERDLKRGRTYGVSASISQEYDYDSYSLGATAAQEWDNGQQEVSIGASAYFDQIRTIYPLELRGEGVPFDRFESNERQSFVGAATYSRIINRRLQVAATAEVAYLTGLLSTTFHRIYFAGPDITPAAYDERLPADDVERLPDSRIRLPVSLRINYFAGDNLAIRSFLRTYVDNWGIRGNSAEVELAYSFAEDWTVMPFGRYYAQQGADYYADIGVHTRDETFYTSDFDLATFTSIKAGVGLRYAPVFGVARGRIRNFGLEFRQVSLRGAYYERNPDLESIGVTLGASFGIRRR